MKKLCLCSFRSRKLHQNLIRMKLTIVFFLMFGLVSMASQGYSQNTRLNVSLKDASIMQLIDQIEQQSEFSFFYKNDQIDIKKPITLHEKDVLISDVLNKALSGTDLTYSVVDKIIVIRPRELTQAQKTVTGKVTSGNGEPLPGVNIIVKGTQQGTITGPDGKYSIDVPQDAVLIFSFVGYKSQEIPVAGKRVINVTMTEEAIGLKEVVAIGYGTRAKRDLTGSMSSVSSSELRKGMYSSVMERLQGKAAGVVISRVSGKPGSNMKVRIRGINSLTSGNEPLYVVDGVPYNVTVNPDNIQSIEVLKGPSATAIYGSRASNGVILITTKEGTKGGLKVDYNVKTGLGRPSKKVKVLNGEEYMKAMNAIDEANGITPEFSPEEISSIGKGTDWQDLIFRTGLTQDHTLSFSGGSDNGTYLASLNYFNEEGVIKRSGLKRYQAQINLRQHTKKFSFGINLSGTYNMRDIMKSEGITNEGAGVTNGSLEFSPVVPAKKDENGYYPKDPYVSLANPLNILYGNFHTNVYDELAVNTFGKYSITSALSVKLRLAGDLQGSRNDLYQSRMTYLGRGENGIASVSTQNNQYYLGEFTATYKKSFGSHNIEVLGGSTYEHFQYRNLSASIFDFPTDVFQTNNLGMGNDDVDKVGSGYNDNTLLSYLGRFNYIFADKYLFTFNFRADGSSRFGENNKFGYFPSGAFAWRISEENFMSRFDFISNLKLRTSYGITGNQAIGNYRSLSTFTSGGTTCINNEPKATLVQARIPNPDLKWESTRQLDVGLDIGLFNDRISGNLDYFLKNTTNMLYSVPVPSSSGFSSFLDNIGKMKNEGIEVSIQTVNLKGRDFRWNTSLNFSYCKNTVQDLGPVTQIVHGGIGHTPLVSIIKVGQTMDSYYGDEVIGIWQEGEDPTNSAQPFAKPGYPKFKDQNNDGTIDDKDRVILGDPFPEYTFSITNDFSYKNFYLSFFIRGVEGRKLLDNNVVASIYPISYHRNRLAEVWENRWTPSNPHAKYPGLLYPHQYGGSQVNSFTVKDASFIRLSNITLGYNIPVNNIDFINKANIQLMVDNVYTLTKWIGYNPEMNWNGENNVEGSYNAYPIPRTFSLGINVQF